MTCSTSYSSQRTESDQSCRPFIVNELIVVFFNQLGLGYTAQRQFASLFGWGGLLAKTFHQKEGRIISTIIANTGDVLKDSVIQVKRAYEAMDPDVCTIPVDITVSYDGSWHKRGHTSMYGVAAVIDVYTGLVIDYVVLSKFCLACTRKKTELGTTSQEFQHWHESHKQQCAINYTGSSGAMEVEAACRLWRRSEARGLRYTGFLSDGDSKAYNAVVKLDVYDVPIVKEECVNHVHKRMGTALRNLTKQKRLGGRGLGRLTQDKTMKLQHYYRYAVLNNVGNADGMRRAIWATLFHCMSTDEEPQHEKCPDGADSWCFYKKAIAMDKVPNSHKQHVRVPLDVSVAKEMVPIYDRLSDPNLLKRMEQGKTQNANESLHNVIWSRCPKTVFVGYHKLHGAVASAIAAFNEGAVHLSQVLQRLAIESNQVMNLYIEETDRLRVMKSKDSSTEVVKRRRTEKWVENRRERHAVEEEEGCSYQPGGFLHLS